MSASIQKKKDVKPKCPKGTRRNKKTGECEAVNKQVEFAAPSEVVIAGQVPIVENPLTIVENPPPTVELKQNERLNKMELKERLELMSTEPLSYLYPNLNDPNFNINIALRKEFNDTQYDGEIKDVIAESEIMCNADFELAPHQLFVRNFLSFQTPYNSLLLYHGLGSGKTCSAISIAEEMRDYLIQMNISNRIIIVASPNVQENFRLQLFDERKLQLIDGLWNIRSCTGNKFLKEINPMNMKGLTKEIIIGQVKRIINTYYVFLGYTEFANYIQKKSTVSDDVKDPKKRNNIIRNKLKQQFSNRLIIIDEVHNIRIADDNPDKKRVAQELFKLVTYADNLRLLLLSATPMYNSYKEIVWLVNLMNLNDRRATIEIKDVFNVDGTFRPMGEDLLIRKATGYISYVRGENPYTFPYKLWPDEFAPEHTFLTHPAPIVQLNGKPLVQNIEFLSLYLVGVGAYQQVGYDYVLNNLKQGTNKKNKTAFENLEAFGYTILQKPIEALNMVYPDERLASEAGPSEAGPSEAGPSTSEAGPGTSEAGPSEAGPSTSEAGPSTSAVDINIDTADLVGSGGLNRLMTFTETVSPPARYDFEYKPSKWGRIFAPTEIGKYSGKIKAICDRIINSTGVILVYSQYIDGGLLPIAIALEELGFTRAGNVRSLFKTPPTEKIDYLSFKSKKNAAGSTFNPAKYVMITGDKGLSPDNVKDINAITDKNNKNGEQVKVVLISLAGSEGLDLKYIRQVHILDPWYNMNRIEQIIGRAVRTCSHKDLPFQKRNVELYLYGSLLQEQREEAVDLYVYRLAELKAVKIGNVSRVIKEIAVDCILNYQQGNFSVENMQQTVQLQLSSGGTLEYAVGDKPYSSTCDYMKKCSYTCKPAYDISKTTELNNATYGESFIMMNNDKIIYKIKQLMKERFFYRKSHLVNMLNALKTYPEMQINAALNQLVEEKNEYITDKYGRLGNLINIGDLYLFQPLELNNEQVSLLDRSMPIEFKHDTIEIDLSKPIVGAPEKTQALQQALAVPAQVQTPAQDVAAPEPETPYTQLIQRLRQYYELARVPNKPKRGEDNWYKFCSEVINEMETLGMKREVLLEAMVAHICDDLISEEKLLLLNGFTTDKDDEFLIQVKKYLLKDVLVNKGLTGIFVQQRGAARLFIKQNNDIWSPAEAEDIHDLEKQILSLKDKYLPPETKLSNVVGFMANFKKEENNIVFKVKVFELNGIKKKRNKGARCYGKSVEMLQAIMGKEIYTAYLALIQVKYKELIEEKKKNRALNRPGVERAEDEQEELEAINHTHACVIQEMYLRAYNIQKKGDRSWFLTPEEALLIDIENLSHTF